MYLQKNNKKNNIIDIKEVTGFRMMHATLKLRRNAYMKHVFIKKRKFLTWLDRFDFIKSTKNIIICSNKIPIMTLRLCTCLLNKPEHAGKYLPSAKIFGAIEMYDNIFNSYKNCVVTEISKLARNFESKLPEFYFFEIYGSIKSEIDKINPNLILISVRRNHILFYSRLGFFVIIQEKFYEADNVWLCLMACTIENFLSMPDNAIKLLQKRGLCQQLLMGDSISTEPH